MAVRDDPSMYFKCPVLVSIELKFSSLGCNLNMYFEEIQSASSLIDQEITIGRELKIPVTKPKGSGGFK